MKIIKDTLLIILFIGGCLCSLYLASFAISYGWHKAYDNTNMALLEAKRQ